MKFSLHTLVQPLFACATVIGIVRSIVLLYGARVLSCLSRRHGNLTNLYDTNLHVSLLFHYSNWDLYTMAIVFAISHGRRVPKL